MKRICSLISIVHLMVTFAVTFSSAEDNSAIAIEENILRKVEKKKGFRPYPLQLMAKRGRVLPAFMTYGNAVFENGPLNKKLVYLVALAAAVANKSKIWIKAHTRSAMDNGATDEEIIQTVLLAGVISNTTPLHIAGEEVLKIIEVKSSQ